MFRRQCSDTWSSTGSQSRPDSAGLVAGLGSRPGSSLFSVTCSTPDNVNFQQLSVTGRRAAFRTQKWSNSFDQSSLAPAPSPGGGRQRQHQPLSLGECCTP